jgi:hypothetical protein
LRVGPLLLLLTVMACSSYDPSWYVRREPEPDELAGLWQLPSERALREHLGDILQIPIEQRQLLLQPDGTCDVEPPLPPTPVEGDPGFLRHPDGCRWQTAFRRSAGIPEAVGVVDLVFSYEGRQRGTTFFARDDRGQLRLWFPAAVAGSRVRAVLTRGAAADEA